MKATTLARTILATTAGFARTASLALATVLALALAACQADVPDDNATNGTAGATITLNLGEKPGMNPVANAMNPNAPATRAFADQHNAWQAGDVVTIKVYFYDKAPTVDENGVTYYGSLIKVDGADFATLTATCTAAADGQSGSGSPATWDFGDSSPVTLPAGVTYLRAEYRYNGPVDALTGTCEVITGTIEQDNVSSIQSIVLPAPEWERKTTLVEVTNVAPGQKVEIIFHIIVTYNGAAVPGVVFTNSDGTTEYNATDDDGRATAIITSQAPANAATALFHLSVIKTQDANGISNPTITGTIGSIYDASNKDASSSKLKNINISCNPGDYFILDARGILTTSGTGGEDAQKAMGDGTEELDPAVFNAANPQWMVTGGGTDDNSTVLNNIVAALEEVAKADPTAPIDLTLPDVTTLEISSTIPSGTTAPFKENKNLRSISAPAVTTISTSQSPFAGCTNLTTVSLPAVTTGVADNTFKGCTALTTVEMPKATTVNSKAFESCNNLTNLDLSAVTAIDATMFQKHPSLTNVKLPAATEIGNGAFYQCPNLTTIDLSGAKTIGSVAFVGCDNLTTINLPVATKIEGGAFNACKNLTTINLPMATTIGSSAFSFCYALTTISLPAATQIDYDTFLVCNKLVTADLPAVTTIGEEAFRYCEKLTTVKLTAEGAFSFVDRDGNSLSDDGCKFIFDGVDTNKCDLYLNKDKNPNSGAEEVVNNSEWLGLTWRSIHYESTTTN